jgi:A/G-specific adenine glycosylase
MTSPAQIKDFHRRLHGWYEANGRKDLPWRNTDDAYAIYVSEIMLQQTQVKTVLDRYYFPFLKRFPTLKALAKAPRRDVLKAWQGLGYYNRATYLHEAAKQCNGALPRSPEALMELPGIGRNTAHAVAAFAWHAPAAVMEANVKRVLTRIFALTHPGEKELWEKAALLLDRQAPFNYNQAMMDIGATLCGKRTPQCGQCPAENICKGKHSPQSYPAAKIKKAVPVRRRHILLLRNKNGEYLARPRTSRFLNGLYQFIESDTINAQFQKRVYDLSKAKKLGGIRQQYSHFTLEADIYLVDGHHGKGKDWHSVAQLKKLPLSMAEQKVMKLL